MTLNQKTNMHQNDPTGARTTDSQDAYADQVRATRAHASAHAPPPTPPQQERLDEEIIGLPERVGPNPGDGERGGSRGEAPRGTVVTRACEGAKGEER